MGLPAHSHNSWCCQGCTARAAGHSLLSIISLLTHFQNLGFPLMEMISYPASKRIKNYLVVLMLFVKDCRNTLHVIHYKQKLLGHKLNIYVDRHYSRHWISKNGKPEVLMTRLHQWRGNTHIYNHVITVIEHMNKRWGQKRERHSGRHNVIKTQ